MRRGRTHRNAIWFSLAAVMFLAAAVLTVVITSVGGRLPFGRIDRLGSEHVQRVAVFVETPSVGLARQVLVSYENAAPDYPTRVTFLLPGRIKARLLISGLASPQGCSSPRTADEVLLNDAQGGGIHTATVAFDYAGEQLYVVTPDPSEFDFHVSCVVEPVARSHTFVTKTALFDFLADTPQRPRLVFADEVRAALGGYQPLPAIILSFGGIEGAEDFSFQGGFQEQELFNYEATRVVAPGDFLRVTWRDVNREQFRDIILIVIGTLIGVGVTVLIEGLRPLIEGFDRPAAAATALSAPEAAREPAQGAASGPQSGPPVPSQSSSSTSR